MDRLADEGRPVRLASEDLRIAAPEDVAKIAEARAELLRAARSFGKAGVTILGAVAPTFFERDDLRMAEAIERAVDSLPPAMRVLCVYRTASLRDDRFNEAVRLTRYHTHSVTALGEGRLVAEEVSNRGRGLRGPGAALPARAVRIERFAQEHRRCASVLHLYDAKGLQAEGLQDGIRVARPPTRSRCLGGGRVVVERGRAAADRTTPFWRRRTLARSWAPTSRRSR